MNLKSTLLIAALAASLTTIAQPVITVNTAPQIGYTVNLAAADTTGVSEGSGGNNQSWNFSSLTQVGSTYTYDYTAPSATPYASKYPNATVAFNSSTSQGNSAYSFVSSSASTYEMWGIATNDVQTVYTNSQMVYQFPFTTSSSFTDYFEGSGTNSQGLTTYRKGNISVAADGYGTLQLPGGTFSNVMRVKVVQEFSDSVNIFGDDFVYEYLITTYNFLHDNFRQQLLGISYTEVTDPFFGTTTLTKSVLYFPGGTVSTGDAMVKNGISIYPNPANEYFTVALPEKSENTTVEIMDMAGKIAGTFPVNETDVNIPTGSLPAGIYTVKVYNNTSVLTVQKIAVTH